MGETFKHLGDKFREDCRRELAEANLIVERNLAGRRAEDVSFCFGFGFGFLFGIAAALVGWTAYLWCIGKL